VGISAGVMAGVMRGALEEFCKGQVRHLSHMTVVVFQADMMDDFKHGLAGQATGTLKE